MSFQGMINEKSKKQAAKKENKNVNDLRKRIEKIHAGEKLAPISQNNYTQSAKRIRIYRNGDAFHKGINVSYIKNKFN